MEQTYFQKGFGLRSEIRPQLRETYRSRIVDVMRANGFRLNLGDLTFLLAMEFGFCYGVERAVEYAYETVAKFPNRRIFLTGEIIHNPHVNNKLHGMGIRFLPNGAEKYNAVRKDDVVIIPAFGIPATDIELLGQKGCVVVDTTCGSVLNVWKNVERYARLGVTSVIHGKYEHEETEATFSRTTLFPEAHYLVIRDKAEAAYVCDYIAIGGDCDAFMDRFRKGVSAGFDPDLHLGSIGLANQTTMLSSESLDIAEMLRVAMVTRYGPEAMTERFHSFDTICSATQDRQDAVRRLENERIDLMIVIGGYNSSNTNNLTKIAGSFTPTFHIEDAAAILSASEIRHKPVGSKKEVVTEDWFPETSKTIGITAGASTPNNQIGEAIERIAGFRGTMDVASILGVQKIMPGPDPKKVNPTAIIPEAPGKITRKKKKPKEIAVVMPDNCTGCEACVSFCPVDCIELTVRDRSDGINVIIPNVQVRFDECIGCKICVNVCERMAWDAIEMWPSDRVEEFFGITLHDKYEDAVAAHQDGEGT